MKNKIKLGLILTLIIISFASTAIVNAATPTCKITLETAKSEFNKNEEFNVDVKISEIQSERGFIVLEAILEYDKDSLTLVGMEGKNNWSTPVNDLSYNEETGKFVIDKNGLAKSDEVILSLKFEVKENSKENVVVTLKNINGSDATGIVAIDTASKNITVKSIQNQTSNPETKPNQGAGKDSTPNPETKPNQGAGEASTSNPETEQNSETVQDNTLTSMQNSVSNQSSYVNSIQVANTINNETNSEISAKIPKAGEDNTLLLIGLDVVAIIGIVCSIIYKLLRGEK